MTALCFLLGTKQKAGLGASAELQKEARIQNADTDYYSVVGFRRRRVLRLWPLGLRRRCRHRRGWRVIDSAHSLHVGTFPLKQRLDTRDAAGGGLRDRKSTRLNS